MSEIGTRTQTEKPDGEGHSYGETSCLIGLVDSISGLAGGQIVLERAAGVTALYDSSGFMA